MPTHNDSTPDIRGLFHFQLLISKRLFLYSLIWLPSDHISSHTHAALIVKVLPPAWSCKLV